MKESINFTILQLFDFDLCAISAQMVSKCPVKPHSSFIKFGKFRNSPSRLVRKRAMKSRYFGRSAQRQSSGQLRGGRFSMLGQLISSGAAIQTSSMQPPARLYRQYHHRHATRIVTISNLRAFTNARRASACRGRGFFTPSAASRKTRAPVAGPAECPLMPADRFTHAARLGNPRTQHNRGAGAGRGLAAWGMTVVSGWNVAGIRNRRWKHVCAIRTGTIGRLAAPRYPARDAGGRQQAIEHFAPYRRMPEDPFAAQAKAQSTAQGHTHLPVLRQY